MDFAVIGNHSDGLQMARALAEAGNRLAVYAGPAGGTAALRQLGQPFETTSDVEELLARPEIDLVIVADDLEHRPNVLRRAMQSERHVLCVHPADLTPDIAYEVAMIQKDTRKVLLPILAERLSPGMTRLRQLYDEGVLGELQLLECERVLHGAQIGWEQSPLLWLWDGLRWLGGEIRDVSALAPSTEELRPGDQVTLTGRFVHRGLFQVTLLPGSEDQRGRLLLRGSKGDAELVTPQGPLGPAQLKLRTADGERNESWEAWNPWGSLVAVLEAASAGRAQPLTWLDGTRCLELFDASRRSVAKSRVVPMHYEEFTEASSFKSAMTSMGCLLLCLAAIVFIVGVALRLPRWVLYLDLVFLGIFLLLQLLRWIVPEEDKS